MRIDVNRFICGIAATLRVFPYNPYSRSFERGIEYGLIFAKILRAPRPVTDTIHADLTPIIRRAARAKRLSYAAKPHVCDGCNPRDHPAGEKWLDITLSETP